MEFINDTFSQIIYLNDFVYIWKIYENKIIELFNKNNYKKIISNIDEPLYDKYINLKEGKIIGYACFDKEIEARTEALNILSEMSHLIKDLFSFEVIEGYQYNENNIISTIYINDELKKIIDINVYKTDKWTIKFNINNNIIYAVDYYYKKYNLINPIISPNNFGLIIFENNKESAREIIKNLKNKYKFLIPNGELKAKEKFLFLKEAGCNCIFEVRKNGIKIKTTYNDLENEIDINDIDEFINNENENIKNNLFNKSLEEEYLLTKTKLSYVCEDCFNKLDKNILLPFNQRIKNKECQCCKNKASKCYFIIN